MRRGEQKERIRGGQSGLSSIFTRSMSPENHHRYYVMSPVPTRAFQGVSGCECMDHVESWLPPGRQLTGGPQSDRDTSSRMTVILLRENLGRTSCWSAGEKHWQKRVYQQVLEQSLATLDLFESACSDAYRWGGKRHSKVEFFLFVFFFPFPLSLYVGHRLS